MPTFQENEAQQVQKPAIVQEMKATDRHMSPVEEISAKAIDFRANIINGSRSPRTEAKEQ
jgi:hypothetical protein